MKKIAITLIALAFCMHAKAQQLPVLPKQQPLQKFRVLPDSLNRNNFSYKLPDSFRNMGTNALVKPNVPANSNIDNMPVARLQGRSNMPVVQTDKTAYNMPVVKTDATASSMPFLGGKQPVYYYFKKNPGANNAEAVPSDNTKK